jgi:hypothetical protein
MQHRGYIYSSEKSNKRLRNLETIKEFDLSQDENKGSK